VPLLVWPDDTEYISVMEINLQGLDMYATYMFLGCGVGECGQLTQIIEVSWRSIYMVGLCMHHTSF
jgi:hypothetical protein